MSQPGCSAQHGVSHVEHGTFRDICAGQAHPRSPYFSPPVTQCVLVAYCCVLVVYCCVLLRFGFGGADRSRNLCLGTQLCFGVFVFLLSQAILAQVKVWAAASGKSSRWCVGAARQTFQGDIVSSFPPPPPPSSLRDREGEGRWLWGGCVSLPSRRASRQG